MSKPDNTFEYFCELRKLQLDPNTNIFYKDDYVVGLIYELTSSSSKPHKITLVCQQTGQHVFDDFSDIYYEIVIEQKIRTLFGDYVLD